MPRFDESIKIETGSYDVGSGRMFLHLSERNDSEGTFVVQGTSSSESVKSRLSYWRDIIRKL